MVKGYVFRVAGGGTGGTHIDGHRYPTFSTLEGGGHASILGVGLRGGTLGGNANGGTSGVGGAGSTGRKAERGG